MQQLNPFFIMAAFMDEVRDLAKRVEAFETPAWAADGILQREACSDVIVDPCTGFGVLAEAALARNCAVLPLDLVDWGYPGTFQVDWLQLAKDDLDNALGGQPFTVFMNPPFSLAEQFVRKALDLGAVKVICFQRFAWYESEDRRPFWDTVPLTRIYLCGSRATCWRFDITEQERRARSGSSTAHAFFIFEPVVQADAPTVHRLYKPAKAKK